MVKPTSHVTNLGVIFDEHLKMTKYVNKICSNGYFQLSNLWVIGGSLTVKLKKQLVVVKILSHIDYCNSLLYGIGVKELKKLQRLINATVRFIYGRRGENRNKNLNDLIKETHFLPIQYRIFYKVALLVHKIWIGAAPEYLEELVSPKTFERTTRLSNDEYLLENFRIEKTKYRNNGFSIAAPKVWNRLPYYIRSCKNTVTFKQNMKTYYFDEYYRRDMSFTEW